jgi:endonuclease YncB( thermonuclease family)
MITLAAMAAALTFPTTALPQPARDAGTDGASRVARILRVVDGDTVDLTNGKKVRLVQIDTPEVYFTPECYAEQASESTRRLLPPGTVVRVFPEPATDAVDSYGRLLRYVVRARDALNVNIRLVAMGAAAPYFYHGNRGRYASRLERLALQARKARVGLWGRCPSTAPDPEHGVRTGPASGTPVAPSPASPSAPPSPAAGDCNPNYNPCLPKVGDLDCGEISASLKPVRVTGSDPYRLDADGDGYGCD